MKLVAFDSNKYNTGKFKVTTDDGKAVKIGLIDPTERAAIIGWINGFACHWDINGIYLTDKGAKNMNLRLEVPTEVVHITITRNKKGKINVYGCTDRLPNVYKRSGELLKRLTVELD